MTIVIDIERDHVYVRGMEKGLIFDVQELVIYDFIIRFNNINDKL